MSILSFIQISKGDFFKIKNIIKDVDRYLAHTPKDENKKPEKLLNHSNLVLEYSIKLIKDNKLENLIDDIFNQISKDIEIINLLKSLFLKAIYWHDFGKINENFQLEKLKNSNFQKVDNKIGSTHSILSSYLYLIDSFNYIDKNIEDNNSKTLLISYSLYFAITIYKHHVSLNDIKNFDFKSLKEYILKTEIDISIENIKKFDNIVVKYLKNIKLFKNEVSNYILSKLLFSLLIISDYYATTQFMFYGDKNELKFNDFGLISESFLEKITKNFNDNINKLKEKKSNLNEIREKLFNEVQNNLIKNYKNRLFYIEAPTGSGKTNLSLMSAIKLLEKDKSLNKIFYVFPFTTLITQTYQVIKESLNLNSNEIVELHSKATYNEKYENYGDKREIFLDNIFMNYPIIMLSHVKFFDILTGVDKENNYIFHRLANSIVIIDEIQSYNPMKWDIVANLLDYLSKNLNIKFIVMSATLPKIGILLEKKEEDKFTHLVTNKKDYFQNEMFSKRVIFKKLNDLKKLKDEKALIKPLLDESKKYFEKNKEVKTIIEFLTKKSADNFYREINNKNKFFDEVYLLSGTILEPRRKEIINALKDKESKNQKILLVTTQVVEAGVDIDMDLGFKEISIPDSDEQLAGRINRNSLKKDNYLFLFNLGNAEYVYNYDLRFKNREEIYKSNIFETKDFDKFYNDGVLKDIINRNSNNFTKNIQDFKNNIRNLNFKEVNLKTKLIESKSLSVFAPLEIKKDSFEKKELELFEEFGVLKEEYKKVNGKKLWDIYDKLILNSDIDFLNKKIDLKKISSLIAKFTFSISIYNRVDLAKLAQYGELKHGFLYLGDSEKKKMHKEEDKRIYDYKNGLNMKLLKYGIEDLII